MVEYILASNNEDFKHIETLASQIWHEHYSAILSYEQIDYMLTNFQSQAAIQTACNQGYLYYIISYDGEYAGYFAVCNQLDKLFMSKLYIKKEFRGRGLGRQAMDKIKSIASSFGTKKVYLSANKNNTVSIAIYKKLGFCITQSVTTDIGGGFVMDDYILECDIVAQ